MKHTILNRAPARAVTTRRVLLRHARYADQAMLAPVYARNVEKPVRALKKLMGRCGLDAISIALTRAGVWPRHRVTTPRQLEAVLGALPRARILRVLHELEAHHG